MIRHPGWSVLLIAGLLAVPARGSAQGSERGAALDAPPPSGPSTAAVPDAPPTARDPSQASGYPAESGRYPEGPRSAGPFPPADGADARAGGYRVMTRLRLLEENLQAVANTGGNGIVDGILSVLAGGLSITFGVLANDETPDSQRFARYLYLWGSVQIARGIVDFSIPLNADEAAIEFQHMPMRDRSEVMARLRFGEAALERVARRARIGRLIDASLNLGVGLAAIPLYLANDHEIDDANDWFVIFASGVSVITGVVNLILKTEAEKRWKAYRKARDRIVGEGDDVDVAFGAAPTRGGAVGLLQGRF